MFNSLASDLVPTDTNEGYDVFVRDLATGTTELLSANAAGTDSLRSWSGVQAVSPDGNVVAFVYSGTELAPGNTSGNFHLYLRDLAAGTTELVSVNADGTGVANAQAGGAVFSPDGTKVAFVSQATDLVDVDDPAEWAADVYVRDLVAGTTTIVSATPSGTAGDAPSGDPAFSPDGSHLAFTSDAGNLSPLDGEDCDGEGSGWPGSCGDVYLHDLTTGTNTLVSVDAAGTASAQAIATDPSFSADGTKVAFSTAAANLGPADSPRLDGNGQPYGAGDQMDVYVRDLAAGTTALASHNAAGDDSGDYAASRGRFAPTGERLLYESMATNVAPADGHRFHPDILLRDLATDDVTVVSAVADPTASGGTSELASWSPDGTRVLFSSSARDLGLTPRGAAPYLYVRDLATGLVTQASAGTDGLGGRGPATSAAWSPDGRRVAYLSPAPDEQVTDGNNGDDVYVSTFAGTDLQVDLVAPVQVVTNTTGRWRVDVTNAGPDPAIGTRLALLFPPGAPVTPAAGCDVTPLPDTTLVACDLGDMADGAATTVTVDAEITAFPNTTIQVVAVRAVRHRRAGARRRHGERREPRGRRPLTVAPVSWVAYAARPCSGSSARSWGPSSPPTTGVCGRRWRPSSTAPFATCPRCCAPASPASRCCSAPWPGSARRVAASTRRASTGCSTASTASPSRSSASTPGSCARSCSWPRTS